ncbi:MAG: LysR family transcriptional regulator [Dehalococcoidales bacterium]|jgi:DNA-binding transcriptional LysR family regulator|nr:LysR family transcriptional regulator [Dehalococcoidales bacterium]MDD3264980.1 LysR family transcriptional regulator [Dehalococcoidales bacterium]MDD4322633.1 LysR family transcriptional regulator [Dehalococcoidales bacterium]MDD4793791.1 LysR family transcriptional regulator [Dehalococcoidales bacterium]MDD5122319.1 LysR family transcriptional regulator [Dehalococcoidales bacterium]
MNLDYLITFRELVRLGSFSAVAKLLSISQPAVSFQIQKLESDLGTTLIDRAQKKLKLTDAGRIVLDFARTVNEEHVRLTSSLDRLRNDITGELKIAASTIPGEFLVPLLLGEFMSTHPETTARVDIMDSAMVIDGVKYGDYKLGFCGSTPPEKDGLSSFKLASDDIVLVASPSHPLASKSQVNLNDIADYSFICREPTSGTRQSLERALAQKSFNLAQMKIRLVLSNTEAVVSAVETGNGIAFVSSIGAKRSLGLGNIIKINIKGIEIHRDIYCVHYAGDESSMLIEGFLSFTRAKAASPSWYYRRPPSNQY